VEKDQRYWQAKKVTLIGAVVNAFLGLSKLIGGIAFHSHALVADGVHSFADLFTDVMVIFASKYGSQEADDSHPYGHGRIETAATMLLSLFLIMAGAAIAWDALTEIIDHTHDNPEFLALPVAVFSIIANEILFHYTHYIGKKISSSLIVANAWHHRSDAASSLIVVIGLVGTLLGFVYLDAAAAIIVGFMIIKMGWNYGWSSIQELVDTAVDEEVLQKIETIIYRGDGVKRIHQLRSRMMAGDILIDVHILVEPTISVSEGHYIAQHVHHQLIEKLERVKDVTVHVDPEDDEICCPSMHLPNRSQLEKKLLLEWQKEFPEIREWVIHYLDGKLLFEVILSSPFDHWEGLRARISEDLKDNESIEQVRLLSVEDIIA